MKAVLLTIKPEQQAKTRMVSKQIRNVDNPIIQQHDPVCYSQTQKPARSPGTWPSGLGLECRT